MKITVNGETRDIAVPASVKSLLETLGINPKTVVVQHNDDIVDRDQFADTLLNDGDVLELVRFVGGG